MALVAEFAEFTAAWSHGRSVHHDLTVLVAEFVANNAAGAASHGDPVARLTATGGTGHRVCRVRRDLAALVAEFAVNNAAGAASDGDLVAKLVATGSTGRRVRRVHHGLVA